MPDDKIKDIMDKSILIGFVNGQRWIISISAIAEDRAGNIQESLEKDTIPIFEDDYKEAIDWVSSGMNWNKIKKHATQLKSDPFDYDYALPYSTFSIVDKTFPYIENGEIPF